MTNEFQQREYKNKGCTLVWAGVHFAVIYKQKGRWAYRCGFEPSGSFIPSNQYSEGFEATKSAAIASAKADIEGFCNA